MKIESNIFEIMAEFEEGAKLKAVTGSVTTNVEYAAAVEEGSTRTIQLQTPRKDGQTPRKSKKSKGIATIEFDNSSTTVITPGAHMFENSREPVADFAEKMILSEPVLNQDGLRNAIAESVMFGKAQIISRTPVDTSRLANSYKEHLPK